MATQLLLLPRFRQVASRLPRRLFATQTCLLHQNVRQTLRHKIFTGAFRNQPSRALSWSSKSSSRTSTVTSPLSSLSRTINRTQNDTSKSPSSFPQISDKSVAYWLLASAASVFGIVIFGGLTRLTESGLSITEWRPVTGSLPPRSAAAWQAEFDKYRASPEFHVLNPNMELAEFKQIYWMEWTHRLWGRVIGLTFLIPTVYYISRRRVSRRMALRLVVISGLIGFQGFLGWWMVKSGLRDELFRPGAHPRVSQYRLAAHLGTAFLVYATMLWNGLAILRAHRLLSLLSTDASAVQGLAATLHSPTLRPFRRVVAVLTLLVGTTALSGALVAGLDAGLIYNEFPYMGLGLTPPKQELFDPFYSRQEAPHGDLIWRNACENPSLVQLDHRILATSTFSAVMALWAWTRWGRRFRGSPGMKGSLLPKEVLLGVRRVTQLVWMQVALGISTLLYLIPTSLAAAHQAGSLALLTGVLVLGSRVCVPRVVQRALKDAHTVKPMGLRPTLGLGQRSKMAGWKTLEGRR